MASIWKCGDKYIVQVFGRDGKRVTIRLGRVKEHVALTAKDHIENLRMETTTGVSRPVETTQWLARLDDKTYARIAAAGFVEPRHRPEVLTLGKWIDEYLHKRTDLKPRTIVNLQSARRLLLGFFEKEGPRPLQTITAGDADDWKIWLGEPQRKNGKRYSQAMIGRTIKRAQQFFRAAARKDLIARNPFADMKAPSQVNEKRKEYVPVEVIDHVLDALESDRDPRSQQGHGDRPTPARASDPPSTRPEDDGRCLAWPLV